MVWLWSCALLLQPSQSYQPLMEPFVPVPAMSVPQLSASAFPPQFQYFLLWLWLIHSTVPTFSLRGCFTENWEVKMPAYVKIASGVRVWKCGWVWSLLTVCLGMEGGRMTSTIPAESRMERVWGYGLTQHVPPQSPIIQKWSGALTCYCWGLALFTPSVTFPTTCTQVFWGNSWYSPKYVMSAFQSALPFFHRLFIST